MSIVSSTYSRGYYRNLKEDCATEAVNCKKSLRKVAEIPSWPSPAGEFWGNISLRFAKIGEYKYIRKAIKIGLFVARSIDVSYHLNLFEILQSQLHKFSNEEITALLSDCELTKHNVPCFRKAFILELVRRKVPGFFSREWLSATRIPRTSDYDGDFYAKLAVERAKNHDSNSFEEATGLARCLDLDHRQEAFAGIILEKFRMTNLNSLCLPLETTESIEWLTLFDLIPNYEKLLPQILAESAVLGGPNAVETAVQQATKIKNKSQRYISYRKIAEKLAEQPGGEASLAAWEVFQLIPKDDSQCFDILSTLMSTFLHKKDRQSFVLARQIPKQIEYRVNLSWLTREFVKRLAERATNSAWAGSLVKLMQKLPPTYAYLEVLDEIAMHIARNSNDETGLIIDNIAKELNDNWKSKIAVTVIMELAKKKIIPISTVLTLATSKLCGENLDTVLQEIANESIKRSSSSEVAMAIAECIESKTIKAEAYCDIAIAELDADSPDAPAKAFKTAQRITECIPRAFALLMIEMKCEEKLR